MAGHPSVKKRQKELQRRERQAEKATKRDERKKGSPGEGGGGEVFESEVVFDADGNATIIQAPAERGDGPPNDAGHGPAVATSE